MRREFALFFGAQFAYYGILCWNIRAVAEGWYVSLVLSDVVIAAITFSLIKKVAEAKSHAARAGYVLGGACGSLASVYLTRLVFGK